MARMQTRLYLRQKDFTVMRVSSHLISTSKRVKSMDLPDFWVPVEVNVSEPIFGADHVLGGKVKKNGKEIKITKPIDAMKNGIAYLPEDRKNDGIIGDLSVRENIIFAMQVMRGFFRPLSKAEANKYAEEYIKLLDIKTASADTPIKSLSGGNQQKCILARWLLTHPDYLILDEPTRGIDIGTKVDIQKLVLKLASEGMSVTFISSETDEMLRTCSRLIVMRDRKVVGELSGEDRHRTRL